MPDVVGVQLDLAMDEIEAAGFAEEVEISGGGTFGVVDESNWTVCEQVPAVGQPLFEPVLTVDRSCPDDESEPPTDDGEPEAVTTEPPSTTTTTPAVEQPLTAATSPELAGVLAEKDECSDVFAVFASEHQGRTIEFDGHLAHVAPHGDYSTRFDFLIGVGDFSESSIIGPNFQFENQNASDLNLTGPNVPDALRAPMKVHVVAQVGTFVPNQCLLKLEPVSMSMR